MFKERRFRWLLLLSILLLAFAGFGVRSSTAHASGGGSVLILDSTVSGGSSSVEAQAAMSLGLSVTVVNSTQWSAMTADQFAKYRAIILGDPTCGNGSTFLNAAAANASVWGRAVQGNVFIIGSDPTFHVDNGLNSAGAQAVINDGIAYATAGEKTGAYVTLSCYYAGASDGTPVPALDAFGKNDFQVVGSALVVPPGYCPGTSSPSSHIIVSSPALGLTDANLSGWSCSPHEVFTKWGPNFQVFAISEDVPSCFVAPDNTTGAPYILVRITGTPVGGCPRH